MDTKAIATLISGIKIKGRLTTDHPASSYGKPVFCDEHNQAIDWFNILEISTAAEMGAKTSERKAQASRINGRKGGRPRKK